MSSNKGRFKINTSNPSIKYCTAENEFNTHTHGAIWMDSTTDINTKENMKEIFARK